MALPQAQADLSLRSGVRVGERKPGEGRLIAGELGVLVRPGPQGVPVRNVAHPVIKQAYNVYQLSSVLALPEGATAA